MILCVQYSIRKLKEYCDTGYDTTALKGSDVLIQKVFPT